MCCYKISSKTVFNTRLHYQCIKLLLATSASAFTWRGIGDRTRSRIRSVRTDYCNALLGVRRKWRPTSCNSCWTAQLVWSTVHTSSTEACRGSCTPSFIDLIYLSDSSTSSAPWCSAAYMAKHPSTCWFLSIGPWRRITATSPIRQPTTPGRTALPAQYRLDYSVPDPMVWNSLPDNLKDPVVSRQF